MAQKKIAARVSLSAMAVCALLVSASAFAAPSISVLRTPALATEGDSYTVAWQTSGAAKVGYKCSGAWNGSQDDVSRDGLGLNGSVNGTYDKSLLGSTTCVWTATAQDGSVSTATESFSSSARSNVPQPSSAFAITKLNGAPYAGSAAPIPADAKSFVVQGIGAKDSRIVISSEGKVFANEGANADGTWSVTVSNGQYGAGFKFPDSGIMNFTAETSKPYTASSSVSFAINVQWAAVELSNVICTKTSFLPGETGVCSVSTKDPNTKFFMNSGYTSWGDVSTTKSVVPAVNTQLSGTYSNGTYSAKITGDYYGYSLTRQIWFENSSGKTPATSVTFSDPNSDDYRKAKEYLTKTYPANSWTSSQGNGSSSSSTSSANSSSSSNASGTSSSSDSASANTNGSVVVVSAGGGAKWSGGKVTTADNTFFTLDGTAVKKSSVRLYRKGFEAEGISTSSNDSGKWSMFNLGTKWYSGVFKAGSNSYVVESVSADGSLKSTATLEIEIVASGTAASSSVSGQSSANGQSSVAGQGTNQDASSVSGNSASNSNGSSSSTSTDSAAVSGNAYATKVSAKLKPKLDAFVKALDARAAAKSDAKASAAYVADIQKKLATLEEKYRASKKLSNLVAIRYLEKEVETLKNAKYSEAASTDEDLLIKDLKESY